MGETKLAKRRKIGQRKKNWPKEGAPDSSEQARFLGGANLL